MSRIKANGQGRDPVIYKLIFPDGCIYVGATNYCTGRRYDHQYDMKLNQHRNKLVQEHYDKYGFPEFRVIENCISANLKSRERHYLLQLKPKLNILKQGTWLGGKHDDISRSKMSVSAKAKFKDPSMRTKYQASIELLLTNRLNTSRSVTFIKNGSKTVFNSVRAFELHYGFKTHGAMRRNLNSNGSYKIRGGVITYG